MFAGQYWYDSSMDNEQGSGYLSIRGAASLVGVTPATMRAWIAAGRVTARRQVIAGRTIVEVDPVSAQAVAGEPLPAFPSGARLGRPRRAERALA